MVTMSKMAQDATVLVDGLQIGHASSSILFAIAGDFMVKKSDNRAQRSCTSVVV